MSTRIGMADGRMTLSVSNREMNDALMAEQKIAFQDNYHYRSYLQAKGPPAAPKLSPDKILIYK